MIQVSIQSVLRLNFPNGTTQDQIDDIVQALESITDPTVEGCKDFESLIKLAAIGGLINKENRKVVTDQLRDVNLWVNDVFQVDKF